MKQLLCIILAIFTVISLAACGGKTQDETAAGFKPALDTKTSCCPFAKRSAARVTPVL